MNSPSSFAPGALSEIDHCWRRIGVWGDKSCPELAEQVHCGNCPVFSAVGRGLLDRAAPEDYLREWAEILRTPAAQKEGTISALVFRLGSEWLALPAVAVVSITERQPAHRLPHRTGKIFTGLVNIAGELQLAFNLRALFELSDEAPLHLSLSPQIYPRLLLCRREGQAFAFLTDEVFGTAVFGVAQMQPPAAAGPALATFVRGQFLFNRRKVNLLDDELLTQAIARQHLA